VLIADAPWLARGRQGHSWPALITRALKWRAHRYDLVLNFEPDIRSNLLAWLTRAPVRMGYASGGGGALLTVASVYDQTAHVAVNAARLVALAAGRPEVGATDQTYPRLIVPDEARRRARELLGLFDRPLVGVHASGGRESKQWHLDRFAAAARQIAATHGATIVLTGQRLTVRWLTPSAPILPTRPSSTSAGVSTWWNLQLCWPSSTCS